MRQKKYNNKKYNNNNNKINLSSRDKIRFDSIMGVIKLLKKYYLLLNIECQKIFLDMIDYVDNIYKNNTSDINPLLSYFEELILNIKKSLIIFNNKELDSIIDKVYEEISYVKALTISDLKINFNYDKEFYEYLDNESMLKFVDLVAPIYEEGLIQFIYGEPKSSKTTFLCFKIMHILKNRNKKAAVIVLNERQNDADKYASISQDCEVYSLAWDSSELTGVNKRQKFQLFNEVFERVVSDPTIDYIIIDSLSRLYELVENIGIGETEDTKEGGQKYTCRDFIRDNYICKIKQYNKSLIATLLLEGRNSLNTKVAKYLKGLGNSDVELSAYLLNKGIFPPVNKNSSSTRDILKLLDLKTFSDKYKSFIRYYENDFRVNSTDQEKVVFYTNFPYKIDEDGDTVINLDDSPINENFELRSLLD